MQLSTVKKTKKIASINSNDSYFKNIFLIYNFWRLKDLFRHPLLLIDYKVKGHYFSLEKLCNLIVLTLNSLLNKVNY